MLLLWAWLLCSFLFRRGGPGCHFSPFRVAFSSPFSLDRFLCAMPPPFPTLPSSSAPPSVLASEEVLLLPRKGSAHCPPPLIFPTLYDSSASLFRGLRPSLLLYWTTDMNRHEGTDAWCHAQRTGSKTMRSHSHYGLAVVVVRIDEGAVQKSCRDYGLHLRGGQSPW